MTPYPQELTSANQPNSEPNSVQPSPDVAYFAPDAAVPTTTASDNAPSVAADTAEQPPRTLVTTTNFDANFAPYQPSPLFIPAQNSYNAPPKTSRSRTTLLTLLGLVLVALGTGVLVWLLKDASFRDQQAVAATAQVTVVAQAVSEAEGRVTATVQAQNLATATAANLATATAQAPATAAAQALQATVGPFEQKADKLFSGSGQLILKNASNLASKYAEVNVRDAVIKAKFFNPDNNNHSWNYGFGFRTTGTNKEYRLYVTYRGYWRFTLANGARDSNGAIVNTVVSDGYVDNINPAAGSPNVLALYVKGEKALFFLNNQYVATLDVTGKMTKGDVFVGTGFVTSDSDVGLTIRYEDFSVSSLDDKGTSI